MANRIAPVDGDLADLLNKTFTNQYRSGYVKFDGCILPKKFAGMVDDIERFEVRDDDVWVCSFPKTGTTWTQELAWSIANDLDFERGKVPIQKRFPSIEFSHIFESPEIMPGNSGSEISQFLAMDSVAAAGKLPSPRFIKTHLPVSLLPRELRTRERRPRLIYVVRNAKDTCISFYHYCKLVEGFAGSFDDFCTLFLGDTLYYGPFWDHVIGYWNKRDDFDMLILKYEDMVEDLPSVIRRTAAFLGKELTKDQVSLLSEHLSFSSMKANPAVNYADTISQIHKMLGVEREGEFMRNGTTGQWRTAMTPDLIKRFDDWTDEHLAGTGLSL